MAEAITEANVATGGSHPNPAVGAVIVHEGRIVAQGHTQPPGGDHAEVCALHAFAEAGLVPNKRTTLYVTLEPCCTYGRTPPCTRRIFESGIRRVVIGATDPNPRHAGRGYDWMRENGIVLKTGVLTDVCEDLNLVFNHWMQNGSALFAGKIATTIDGRIATRTGSSQWITGEKARQNVALWRRRFPAIAVGGETVLRDNPRLTSRLPGRAEWCPRRLIFDRAGRCLHHPGQQVFADDYAHRSVYISCPAQIAQVPVAWKNRGVEVWPWEGWEALRARCLAEELTGVYVEGGTGLLSDLLGANELDYLFAYRAPRIIADAEAPGPFKGRETLDLNDSLTLSSVRHAVCGDDQLLRGFVNKSP